MTREDLLNRCSNFGVNCIFLTRKIPRNFENSIIFNQIIRSSCSVGANYSEAVESESKKDFIHKILICKKEIKETIHWLFILEKINMNLNNSLNFDNCLQEANELLKIFSKTVYTSRNNIN
ncbi:four helix bundle protein [Patescibacteria group bacterium]|nr:four helix bundle protein [Patescibacteria group bacterium]